LCNRFIGWDDDFRKYCGYSDGFNPSQCIRTTYRYTYKTGKPDGNKWFLPAMMNFGRPVFNRLTEVVYLDRYDRPIIDTVYALIDGMWKPINL